MSLCIASQPKEGQVNPVRAGRGAEPWGFCKGPKFRALEVVGCSIPEGDVPPLLPKMRYSECLGSALLPSSPGLSAQAAWLRPREQSQQGGQWLLPATPPGGQPQLCLVHLQVRLLLGRAWGVGRILDMGVKRAGRYSGRSSQRDWEVLGCLQNCRCFSKRVSQNCLDLKWRLGRPASLSRSLLLHPQGQSWIQILGGTMEPLRAPPPSPIVLGGERWP